MKIDDSAGSVSHPLRPRRPYSRSRLYASLALPPGRQPGELEAAFLRVLFEQSLSAIAVLQGPAHVIGAANKPFSQLTGRHTPLLGLPVAEAVPALADQGFVAHADLAYASGGVTVGRQLRVRDGMPGSSDNPDRYVDFTFQPLFGLDGRVFGVFVHGQDVTEQAAALAALKLSNERWKFAIEGARDAVWDWDVCTNEIFVSDRYFEIQGDALRTGMLDFSEWAKNVHPEDRPDVLKALRDTLQGGPPYHVEYRQLCVDGRYKWVLSRGVIVARAADGTPTRLTGTLSDISEQKLAAAAVLHHASVDHLTGLPNRRLFRDRLEQEIRHAVRGDCTLALLFIDLDRFKEVNDLRGHDTGDQLLVQVASRLAGQVRESDTVARLGGDEFAVILSNLRGASHVEQIVQKLLGAMAEPFDIEGNVMYVSASIGISLHPADAATSEELIRTSDQAMYAAKHAGRNQFRFFTPAMQVAAQHRLQLIADLRVALKTEQLEVHYQPIVELATGRVTKAEALLRWRHPALGFVSPGEFIPPAEESGLIHEIGDWVFEQAAERSQQWARQLGRAFPISVNCSPVQILARPGSDWPAVLAGKGMPAPSIVLEITEGILLKGSERVADVFYCYRASGIQLALDDFGTGYSSLSYLTQFEIDFLKIDQSFVRGIDRDARRRAIVESMIAMAHRLGMKVIAEGIETGEQEHILRAAGCNYGQGFLFSKALPPDDFSAFLSRHR